MTFPLPGHATTRARRNAAPPQALWALALYLSAASALAAPVTGTTPAASTGGEAPAAPAAATRIDPTERADPGQAAAAPPVAPPAAAPGLSTDPAALAPDPDAAAEGDSRVGILLQKALTLLGTPYRWGGTDPAKGFDCSGLVGYVFRTALGIELPRVSRDMARSGERVADRARLAAGDLVFFGLKGRINHVGIYLGEGRFLHAPSRGKDVRVSSLDQGYWGARFLQARRVGTDGG